LGKQDLYDLWGYCVPCHLKKIFWNFLTAYPGYLLEVSWKLAVGRIRRRAAVCVSVLAEQSRRDDLEALAYMFIYFLRGSLPWQGIRGGATSTDRFKRIAQCKAKTTVEQLCSGLPGIRACAQRSTSGELPPPPLSARICFCNPRSPLRGNVRTILVRGSMPPEAKKI